MRLPNGTGSVTKLSGKRRKPYCARVTTGWDLVDGKAIQKRSILGYYETRSKALQALMLYNADPWDLNKEKLTFKQVYDLWLEEYTPTVKPSSIRSIRSAYNYSTALYDMPFEDIRVYHMEQAIKSSGATEPTQARMKSLFNLLFRYAMIHEIVQKNYAELFSVRRPDAQLERVPFTEEEVNALWENLDFPFTDMVLIALYTGLRPQEVSLLEVANIHLDQGIMYGGMKTKAGKDRCIPIHSKITPLISSRIDSITEDGQIYLFGDCHTYDRYRRKFDRVMLRISAKHRMHDTRHTFITWAKDADINEYILKRIVGHAINDVTEGVYTHRDIEDLRREIEKIK